MPEGPEPCPVEPPSRLVLEAAAVASELSEDFAEPREVYEAAVAAVVDTMDRHRPKQAGVFIKTQLTHDVRWSVKLAELVAIDVIARIRANCPHAYAILTCGRRIAELTIHKLVELIRKHAPEAMIIRHSVATLEIQLGDDPYSLIKLYSFGQRNKTLRGYYADTMFVGNVDEDHPSAGEHVGAFADIRGSRVVWFCESERAKEHRRELLRGDAFDREARLRAEGVK